MKSRRIFETPRGFREARRFLLFLVGFVCRVLRLYPPFVIWGLAYPGLGAS